MEDEEMKKIIKVMSRPKIEIPYYEEFFDKLDANKTNSKRVKKLILNFLKTNW